MKNKKNKKNRNQKFQSKEIERRRRVIDLLKTQPVKKEPGQALTTDALDDIVRKLEEKTNEQRVEVDFDLLSDEERIRFLFDKVNRQEKELLASQMYIGYAIRVLMDMHKEFGLAVSKLGELNEEIDKLKGSSSKWDRIEKVSNDCLGYLQGIQKAIDDAETAGGGGSDG